MTANCNHGLNDTFALERCRLFVLAGAIAEGQICAGMIVSVPLNSSLLSLGSSEHRICPDDQWTRGHLPLHCLQNSDELSIWNGLSSQKRDGRRSVRDAIQLNRSLIGDDDRLGSFAT